MSIDASVPIDETAEGGASRWLRLWTISGVTRWVSKVDPSLIVQAPEYTYSADTRRRLRRLVLRNDSTPAVVEESQYIPRNIEAVPGLTVPADLPGLLLLAQDTIDHLPSRPSAHERQLAGLERSQLVVIDDGHHSASLSPSTAAEPQRVINVISVVGCGTFSCSPVQQNCRQVIESSTSWHND